MSLEVSYRYQPMCRYLVEDENGEAVPFMDNDGNVLANKDYSLPNDILPDCPLDSPLQYEDSPLVDLPFYRSRITSLVDPSKQYISVRDLWQEAKSKAVFVEYYIQGTKRTLDDNRVFLGDELLEPLTLLRIPVTHGKNGRATIQWGKAVDGDGKKVEVITSAASNRRSIGPANKPMRIFLEDAASSGFFEQPEKAEKLALHLQRSMGWSEHHWSLSTLADDLKYLNGGHTSELLTQMVACEKATEDASFTEFHFSQPEEASENYGEKKLTAAPAGKKQIWCEYPTNYGWPMGNQFLSVELVYPQGEEPLGIFDLCGQFRRTCRSLAKEDASKFGGCFSYVRVTQREAASNDEIGAHVYYLDEITEEFAKEWSYPRDKWYEYPCLYL